jgi:hypothetical protein
LAIGRWKNRDFAEAPVHSPRTTVVRHSNRNNQCATLGRYLAYRRNAICRVRSIGASAQRGGHASLVVHAAEVAAVIEKAALVE